MKKMIGFLALLVICCGWTAVRDARYYTNEQRFEKPVRMEDTFKVDTVSELTSGNGVAVDGVTLKDGGVEPSGSISLTGAGEGVTLNSGTLAVTNAGPGDGVTIDSTSDVEAARLSVFGPGGGIGGRLELNYGTTGSNGTVGLPGEVKLYDEGVSTETVSLTHDEGLYLTGVGIGVTNVAVSADALAIYFNGKKQFSITRTSPGAARMSVGVPNEGIDLTSTLIDMNTNELTEVDFLGYTPRTTASLPAFSGGELLYWAGTSTGLYFNVTGVWHKVTTAVAP